MLEVKSENIYQLEGRVPLKIALPLGIQHLLAMFLGNISPLIIVCGMLQMDTGLKTTLIQNSMFIAGITTLIQIYPVLKVGSGLPGVMGTSSGFLGTGKAIGLTHGYGVLMGASIFGAIFEMILGYFIKPLKKLFPPIVTSLVIISIGLSLLPVGIRYFGGGFTSEFGDIKHLIVGSFVIVLIIILNQVKNRVIRSSAILISIILGYILAILMGMVDFTAVKDAAWISLPNFMPVKIEFNLNAIIAMLIMYIATAVETVGDLSGIANGGLDREPTDDELCGGVMADGFGSLIAAFFGVLPNTTFSQNVGLVTVTKVVNRFVIGTGAVVLVLMGFVPKLSAIFTVMPQSVLGGATVIMFAMIFVSGLKSLLREEIDERKGLIIAVSLGLGVGIGNVPDTLVQLPKWVGQIFAQNGIIMTFVIATCLNLLLPKKK